MREILFRGKRLDNGEWVTGYLEYFYSKAGTRKLHCFISVWGETLHTVDPATVGQYTGLKANGKRIFEGDILRCWLGDKIDIGVVQYDDRIAAFIVLFTDGVLTFLDFFTAKVETWYEVIGNIHDNPERELEGGQT
mgnify:CR=1 FL=1